MTPFPVISVFRRDIPRRVMQVPWGMMEPLREVAMLIHDQTLERLAERGGLCSGEILGLSAAHVSGHTGRKLVDTLRRFWSATETSNTDMLLVVLALVAWAEAINERSRTGATRRERVLRIAGFTPVPEELKDHSLFCSDSGTDLEFVGPSGTAQLLAAARFGIAVSKTLGEHLFCGVSEQIPGYSPVNLDARREAYATVISEWAPVLDGLASR